MMKRLFLFLVLVTAPVAPGGEEVGFVSLFNGKDLSGWVPVNVASSTFTVKDGMIICDGKPTGVMRTDRQYENFIVELEWRHMVPKGNAGFFVWSDAITSRGVPFTRSIEVQVLDGHNADTHTSHGDIFPIHGAKMVPVNGRGGDRAFPTELRANPSPEWNHYRIECVAGNITLAVNGKVVTQGQSSSPRKGYICLESEGGVVHWRNLRIKELPPGPEPLASEQVAAIDQGFVSLYTGVDFSGWQMNETLAMFWKVSDWTFFNDGKSDGDMTLWTTRAFGDHTFILDFKLEQGASLNLVLDKESGKSLELGATTKGAAPPGHWNRLELVRRGETAKATLNGRHWADLSGLSRGTSPLGLCPQGLVSFANVYVLESHQE